MKSLHQNTQGGYQLILVLVFAGIFMTMLTSFVVFIVTQSRLIEQRIQFEQSGEVAEAGLNYFKWYLAHYPNSATTSMAGIYNDPEGGAIGEYSLTVASTTYCGDVSHLTVTAIGYTYKAPNVRRTLTARYAQPTVADYSFIINNNVWAESGDQVVGPFHSNGGVRMDGSHNSTVTSGQSSWSCTSSFGCSTTETRNGVFTTTGNANSSLFSYPRAPISFSGITVDLAQIQNKATNESGLYFGPSGRQGYHVIFLSNGQVEVRRVNSKVNEPNGLAWGYYMHVLNGTTLIGTYNIPTSCPVLFFEDQIWLEGTVRGKVTIAAADVDTTGVDRSIFLNNNINYATATSGLMAIAEYDVTIPLEVPDVMTINGIYVAQNGRFGRNYYSESDIPSAWDDYVKRNSLTINGTIVTNGTIGTKWYTGAVYVSGFNNRYSSYDRNIVLSPPPYTPKTSDVYEFSDWRDAN